MKPMNGTHQREILSRPRARRDAAKTLAVALQTRLRRLYDAQSENDEDAIVVATADLAQCMYENIEFVIWSLKHTGGMNPSPPEDLHKVTPIAERPKLPTFQKPEPVKLDPELPCTCPPLEAGIIGRDKHMTSCPKFVP